MQTSVQPPASNRVGLRSTSRLRKGREILGLIESNLAKMESVTNRQSVTKPADHNNPIEAYINKPPATKTGKRSKSSSDFDYENLLDCAEVRKMDLY